MQGDVSTTGSELDVAGEIEKLTEEARLESRLTFLYRVVEDTQGTIRFLDTKAAFCVPLLSAMVAGALQRTAANVGPHHHALFIAFMAGTTITLLVCMRVIFPTIKPSNSLLGSKGPKFYIGHNKAHHWLLHTVRDNLGDVLSETHNSYVSVMKATSDNDLLNSMCDEVLMVALIRQVKSDRLHAALFCLTGTVFLFLAVMLF
ncbi:hypothetical protein [Granulicella sibirica]|uniref:Pycsar effector protein domain-containing protein n=1 Tax=Granulicella sibirica TaxID=2479048 RepID=A0A4Q0T0S9_9BACT|nr:hypothetical protein [Granulicella sibirica]RXH55940.1 hypothetical protein GRAN_2797 [Granulicella sibirica]